MDFLLKSLEGGAPPRFIWTWIFPSSVLLGVCLVFLYPSLEDPGTPFVIAQRIGDAAGGTQVAIFVACALILAVLFSSFEVICIRALEGLYLPKPVRNRLRRRHVRRVNDLRRIVAGEAAGVPQQFDLEGRYGRHAAELALYPSSDEAVMPTRLGNALRTLATFGHTRYGLDSQRLWFELQAVASVETRKDVEDARSQVDWMVSVMMHSAALALLGGATSILTSRTRVVPAIVGLLAAVILPLTYRGAMVSIADWGMTVKALVNISRLALAERLGLTMPSSLEGERLMWNSYLGSIEYDSTAWLPWYDLFRSGDALDLTAIREDGDGVEDGGDASPM